MLGGNKGPAGRLLKRAKSQAKRKASPVRKKTVKKAPRRGVASASPVGRRRKTTTGGGVTPGPRSSRTRKTTGTGSGGSSLRSRFASLSPAQKRAAARRIARRRGR